MNKIKRDIRYLLMVASLFLFSCSNEVKDIDNNHYNLIKIGKQIWMLENLNVSHFRNGDPIPEVSSAGEWTRYAEEGKPAWCIVQNEPGNDKKYGKLYNWYAVNDPRGVSPKGFHVPSDNEWIEMINFLGSGVLAAMNMRVAGPGTSEKGAMQNGFSGLPGGARSENGGFYGFASYGYWWSSTEAFRIKAWMLLLDYTRCDVNSLTYGKGYGISVRCISDKKL